MPRRLPSTNALPAALALQGLCLILFAWVARPGTGPSAPPAAAGAEAGAAPKRPVTPAPDEPEPPHLAALERFPEEPYSLDEVLAPRDPARREPPEPRTVAPVLADSRITTVDLAEPLPASASAGFPDAPDALQPHSIDDGRPWLTRDGPLPATPLQPTSGVGGGHGGWGIWGVGGSGRGVGGSRGRPRGTPEGPRGVSDRGGEGGSDAPKGTPKGKGHRGPTKSRGKNKSM